MILNVASISAHPIGMTTLYGLNSSSVALLWTQNCSAGVFHSETEIDISFFHHSFMNIEKNTDRGPLGSQDVESSLITSHSEDEMCPNFRIRGFF